MYLPDHFKEADPDEIASTIAAAPLACVVAQTPEGLVANHIPMLLSKDGDLVGHFALANDFHTLVEDGQEVLVIFKGVDGYISPNTYPSKQEHHRHVPTWNYQVVHVYGAITFHHDERSKRAAVAMLTRDQEQQLNGSKAWRMSDAPAEYMVDMLSKIVAFRVSISRTIAKSKFSQNRDRRDIEGVIEGLRSTGRESLAKRMEMHRAGKRK